MLYLSYDVVILIFTGTQLSHDDAVPTYASSTINAPCTYSLLAYMFLENMPLCSYLPVTSLLRKRITKITLVMYHLWNRALSNLSNIN